MVICTSVKESLRAQAVLTEAAIRSICEPTIALNIVVALLWSAVGLVIFWRTALHWLPACRGLLTSLSLPAGLQCDAAPADQMGRFRTHPLYRFAHWAEPVGVDP